jgi:hypothetical protein
MCRTSHDRKNMFGQRYYDSNYLNHNTKWNKRSNYRNSLKMIINCDCPLNIEHCDHTSAAPNQSRQYPWVSFLNLPLLCLFLCARTAHPYSFYFHGEEDYGPVADKTEFIKFGVPHGSRKPSFRLKVLLTLYYLQAWMPTGVDQVGDNLPWDRENDDPEGTCWKEQDVLDFVSSLVLLWASFEQEVGSRRVRAP